MNPPTQTNDGTRQPFWSSAASFVAAAITIIACVVSVMTLALNVWMGFGKAKIESLHADIELIKVLYPDLSSKELERRDYAWMFLGGLNPKLQARLLRPLSLLDASRAMQLVTLIAEDENIADPDVRSSIERTRRSISERFLIVSPLDGEQVGLTAEVLGTTCYPSENHFAVVTTATGEQFLQDEPMNMTGELFSTRVHVGSASVGAGQWYTVYVFASSKAPDQVRRTWPTPPSDIRATNAVSVIRR